MTNIRVKIATAATILGLGGLGGFAMASNPAYDTQASAPIQVAATQAGSARQAGSAPATSQPIVTGASGATSPAVPLATQPASAAKPVLTHASGGGAGKSRRPAREGDDAAVQYKD